jgi:hypothetical protein
MVRLTQPITRISRPVPFSMTLPHHFALFAKGWAPPTHPKHGVSRFRTVRNGGKFPSRKQLHIKPQDISPRHENF